MSRVNLQRAINKARRFYDWTKTKVGADVVLQGSTRTTNIGDIAPSLVLQDAIGDVGLSSHIIGLISGRPDFTKYRVHIVAGGGVIRDYSTGYLDNPTGPLEARLHPIKDVDVSMAIGVGVPDIRTDYGKSLVKRMNYMKLVTVRDYRSVDILSKLIDTPVRLTACPSFLLEPSNGINIGKSDRPSLGINLVPYFMIDSDTEPEFKMMSYELIINRIRDLINSGKYDCYGIPHTIYDWSSMKKMLRGTDIKILPLQDPRSTLGTIKQMNKMITTRYHSLIFSLIADVPIYPIRYETKVDLLADSVDLVGYEIPSKEEPDISFETPSEHGFWELMCGAQSNITMMEECLEKHDILH